jgi:hypothetical protein
MLESPLTAYPVSRYSPAGIQVILARALSVATAPAAKPGRKG